MPHSMHHFTRCRLFVHNFFFAVKRTNLRRQRRLVQRSGELGTKMYVQDHLCAMPPCIREGPEIRSKPVIFPSGRAIRRNGVFRS